MGSNGDSLPPSLPHSLIHLMQQYLFNSIVIYDLSTVFRCWGFSNEQKRQIPAHRGLHSLTLASLNVISNNLLIKISTKHQDLNIPKFTVMGFYLRNTLKLLSNIGQR